MNLRNISFYGAIGVILLTIIVIKKTAYDPIIPSTKTSNPSNSSANMVNEETSYSQQEEENIDTSETSNTQAKSVENNLDSEKPFEPDYELAKKELMQNQELAKEAQKSVYPYIVEGVKKELHTKEDGERVMGLLQICMTDQTVAQNPEVRANCVMGAREIAKKFPELNKNLEEQVLKYASPDVKALADKLSSQQ